MTSSLVPLEAGRKRRAEATALCVCEDRLKVVAGDSRLALVRMSLEVRDMLARKWLYGSRRRFAVCCGRSESLRMM
jgi:hypothetical protein